MLDIKPLLVISFANIFFPFSRLPFCLWFPLLSKKLLSLIRFHLFVVVIIFFTFADGPNKYCCDLCQSVFCLCFPIGVLYNLVLCLVC